MLSKEKAVNLKYFPPNKQKVDVKTGYLTNHIAVL
jgi:hypothetical protein